MKIASIIKLIILLAFLLVNYPQLAFAESINSPSIDACPTTSGTCANYDPYDCVQTSDIVASSGQIYTCRDIMRNVFPQQNNPAFSMQLLRVACWQAFNPNNSYATSGAAINGGKIIVSRKIDLVSAGSIPIDYAHPCILKKSDPDPAQQPTCNINAAALIKGAFAHKFPLDIIGDAPFQAEGSTQSSCPLIQIADQSFEACYLLDLVKGLKYPLLLIFVFGALTRF